MPAVAPVTRAVAPAVGMRPVNHVPRAACRPRHADPAPSGMMAPMTARLRPRSSRSPTRRVASRRRRPWPRSGPRWPSSASKVLLVDLDPQACLTFSLGIDPEDLELSVHHVLTKGARPGRGDHRRPTTASTCCRPRSSWPAPRPTCSPAPAASTCIKRALEDLARPATTTTGCCSTARRRSGVLTVAALTAADGVLIPLQCETLSHRGVGQLLDTVHDVRRFTNRDLAVWGVLPDAVRRPHQPRARGARDDLRDLRPRGRRAADPQDDQVRRGARRRPLDPRAPPAAARARRPTARSPATWSPERLEVAARQTSGQHRDAADGSPPAGRSGRATAGSRCWGRASWSPRSRCSAALGRAARPGAGPADAAPAAAVGRPARVRRSPRDDASTPRRAERRPDAADAPRPTSARREPGRRPTAAADASGSRCRRAARGLRLRPTRVVFSESRQRVWLVTRRRSVARTYLVSGSVYDNLDPGTYEVYSRSERACGIDDSGDDEVLRAVHPGRQRRAIGFHDIPVDDGQPGADARPSSAPRCRHGCIRQERRRRQGAVGLRPARHRRSSSSA